MLGIGKIIVLLEKIFLEVHESNARLLGCQIKLDTLIGLHRELPFKEQPTENSPYLGKDGLYNFQEWKKNKIRKANGEDGE